MSNKYYYTYLIYDPVLNMKYIGSRASMIKPEFDTKYMGTVSSKKWKSEWKNIKIRCSKKILKVFDNFKDMLEHEVFLHNYHDVAKNPLFFNEAKQTTTKFTTTGIKHSEDACKKISESHSGEKHPMFDNTIRTWFNERNEDYFVGTTYALISKYTKNSRNSIGHSFRRVAKGVLRVYYGWIHVGVGEISLIEVQELLKNRPKIGRRYLTKVLKPGDPPRKITRKPKQIIRENPIKTYIQNPDKASPLLQEYYKKRRKYVKNANPG